MRHESFRRCSLQGVELEKKVESICTVVVIVVEGSGVGYGWVHGNLTSTKELEKRIYSENSISDASFTYVFSLY